MIVHVKCPTQVLEGKMKSPSNIGSFFFFFFFIKIHNFIVKEVSKIQIRVFRV